MAMWDIYQHMQVRNLRQNQYAAEEASSVRAARQDNQVEDLEAKVDKLTLICEAMWTLLTQRLGVSVQELVQVMHDIDLQDGQLDGRKSSPPKPCPSCQAMVAAELSRCQFCGASVPNLDPFIL
jgi:hypothetical protein